MRLLGLESPQVLKRKTFYSKFNYCLLFWMFFYAISLKKVQVLQKRALRFLYDDYHFRSEKILKKSDKISVELNRLRYICGEICKSISKIMKQFFQLRQTNRTVRSQHKLNFSVRNFNQVSYGEERLRYYRLLISVTPFRVMSRLVEILKLSKTLLKIGMVLHATVGSVRVDLIKFCFKSFSHFSNTC